MTRAKPGDALSLRHDDVIPAWTSGSEEPVPEERPAETLGAERDSAPSMDERPPRRRRIATYLYLFSTVIFAGALAVDPVGRFFIAPLIVLAVLVAVLFVAALVIVRQELWAIFSNRAIRVVHGLEHACIAILYERGYRPVSGRTREGAFEVVLAGVTPTAAVRDATREAIERFSRGDTRTAYSPMCGTSRVVGMTLYALVVLGCTVASIVFGVPASSAFMAAAVLGVIAMMAWRPLGLLAQRTLTVSTRFARATVGKVTRGRDDGGRRTFDVTCTVTL